MSTLSPPSDLLALLQRNPIFQGLTEAAVQHALQRGNPCAVEEGGFLVHQGEPALTFHILTKGHVKLLQVTPDGHEILIRFLGPGQEFCVISLLSGQEHPLSARAQEDCEAWVWAGEVMAQLMEQYPAIGFNALRAMAARNRLLMRRYQELLTESVEQRLAQGMLNLIASVGRPVASGTLIDMPLTEEDLAELTGTTIYSVSRILNKWQRQGLVESGRRWVIVCKPRALKALLPV